MPLSTTELKAILQAEKSDALAGMNASKLESEREKALDYYMGDMSRDMPSQPDRSKAVSSDVADTVEGLMPGLMEIFAGGDEVVEFQPVGPEDEEAAQQETDYVNHVFTQKNPGFLVLYTFIKDALLSKNGIVKVWWEETETETEETYRNLPDDVYALLMADKGIEIVAHSEMPQGEQAPALHDVTIRTTKTYGCAKAVGVPPEEFGISRSAKIGDRRPKYCFHETKRTVSDLIADGFDADQLKDLGAANADVSGESQARNTVDDTSGAATGTKNEANREIDVTEHYCMLDYNDDGNAALYRVTTGGEGMDVLLRDGEPDIVKVDMAPFAAMTPIIMTHRFFGRSIADLVMDIQRIKTALVRSLLDNAYLANNQRMEIAESHAGKNTIDDMLNNRPAGIVRTKQPGGLLPIPNQSIGNFAYPLLEYFDATREWRTGVTRQGQGIDPNALQNIGENAILDAANAARARQKLIARIFAETGIRDLFALLHATIRKNDRQENTVKLRNKWVPVNPRDWKERNDMTINVGLGGGSKQQDIAFLSMLLGIQKEAVAVPQLNLVKPKNIYNTADKLVQKMGWKNVETFFHDPESDKPPEPAPDPKMLELQAKNEIEKTQAQADITVQNQKTQAEIQLAQAKFEFDKQLKVMDFQLKQQGSERDFNMKVEGEGGKMLSQVTQELQDHSASQAQTILQTLLPVLQHLSQQISAPKRVIRDPKTQRVVGVETVPAAPQGRLQ